MKIPLIGTSEEIEVPSILNAYIPLFAYRLKNLKIFREHRRLKVFYHKGLECANPSCNRHGVILIKAKDCHGGIHIDLYTEDFVLMTVDHTIPKAKGGNELLSNKQPMCQPCNTEKGCKIIVY